MVFFLLVFALLIGRMDATAPFDVSPPISASGSDMPAGGLTISVARTGDLALDGEPATLLDVLERAKSRAPQAPAPRMRINADSATALRHVLPLVQALKQTGAEDIVLVVTPNAP